MNTQTHFGRRLFILQKISPLDRSLAYFSIILLFTSIVSGYFLTAVNQRSRFKDIEVGLGTLNQARSDYFAKQLENEVEYIRLLSTYSEVLEVVSGNADATEVQPRFDAILADHPETKRIVLTDIDGRSIVFTSQMVQEDTFNIQGTEWFREIVIEQNAGVYIQAASLDHLAFGASGVHIIVPIYDDTNTDVVRGALSFVVNQDEFVLRAAKTHAAVGVYLPSGLPIVSQNRSVAERTLLNREIRNLAQNNVAGTAIVGAKNNYQVLTYSTLRNLDLGSGSSTENLGWIIVSTLPEATWAENLRATTVVIWIVMLTLAVLVCVSLYVATREIHVGLTDLSRSAQTIVEEKKISLAIPYSSQSNLQHLSVALRYLTAQLRFRSNQLNTVAQFAQEANLAQDVDHFLDLTARSLYKRFDYQAVRIYTVQSGSVKANIKVAYGIMSDQTKNPEFGLLVDERSPLGQAIRTGNLIHDVGFDPSFKGTEVRPAEVIIPFTGQVEGALHVIGSKPNDFDQQDIEIFRVVANQIGATLDSRILFTEMQAAQREAEEANQAKNVFLTNMSHELRTPLNAILGYAQILKGQISDDHIDHNLTIILQSGDHLLALINDILDLSKLGKGKIDLHPAPIHLPKFLETIMAMAQSRVMYKDLVLQLDVRGRLPVGIIADEIRLRQILLNLLGNAVKFTDEGNVTLRITAVGKSHNTPQEAVVRLRFEVEDTGRGISPKQLERIFQPFEQVAEPDHPTGGTGLGLAISRQLVQLMNGEIHVTSEVGKGSMFWFEIDLPIGKAPSETPTLHLLDRNIVGYIGPVKNILVVDDILSNRKMLSETLQMLGFEVIQAENGAKAVQIARDIHFDLILVDLWMPDMQGTDTVRLLRQIPYLTEVPIIAISASVSEDNRKLSLKAGFDDFLAKPIWRGELLLVLQKFLNLNWIYEETSVPNTDRSAMILPPGDILGQILQLAKLGDMQSIQKQTISIEKSDERFKPFAIHIRQLARAFEDKKIVSIVEGIIGNPQ